MASYIVPISIIIVGVALFLSAFFPRPRRDFSLRQVPGAHIAHRKRSGWSTAVRAIGGLVIAGFGAWVTAIIYGLGHMGDMTMGRVLRLRGKATLPARARGGGWHDGAAPRVDHLGDVERRVLAQAWLVSAQMEHASVAVFAQLSLHLAALGAPSELVERTHRAALDEIKHARRCFAFARAFGGEAETAGPIAELAQAERGGAPIDRIRLAIGSLVDGCVAEGIAADVAAHGARGASDPVIRDALAMIAGDEQQHAELAWSVLAWCLDSGGDEVRAAVAARVAKLDNELAPRAPDFPGIAPDRLAPHGLFDQDTLGAIATRRIAATRARATEIVATAARAA